MNAERISQLLAATVGPERDQANQAEKELDSMQKVIFDKICDFADSFFSDPWFPRHNPSNCNERVD